MRLVTRTVLLAAAAIPLLLAACRSSAGSGAGGYATRTSSGDISFEITPRGVVEGRFVIEVRANTHHGDLAELDLARVVTLVADGAELRPVAADRLGGHHALGRVTFPVAAPPERFEIVVRGARALPELRFRWP